MKEKLLHVYRNTARGRETLLQSAWFCKQTGSQLEVYVPRHAQFLMYFKDCVATVSLDSSYLRSSETAQEHVRHTLEQAQVPATIVEPTGFTADTLPNLSIDYSFMACPRSMSELSGKIRIGHIGPRVRAIVNSAPFLTLLPTPIYKPWGQVVACFGGSEFSLHALRCAQQVSKRAEVPLSLFTWAEAGKTREHYEEVLADANLLGLIRDGSLPWIFGEGCSLEESVYDIPRDALVALGAYGIGSIRKALFGSMLETIQSEVPNNLLVVGPQSH